MLAIFQVPNKFFEADGRVVDAAGQEWDETSHHQGLRSVRSRLLGRLRPSLQCRLVATKRTCRSCIPMSVIQRVNGPSSGALRRPQLTNAPGVETAKYSRHYRRL